jgi:hypothetical protein
MEVKGTALITTRDYVKNHYPERYQAWIDSLPDTSKHLLMGTVMNAGWYPLKEGYVVPVDRITSMFFSNNAQACGDALGRYSADIALNGIYKAFLMIATPKFLMQRASSIMSNYYKPSEIITIENGPKQVTLEISKFDEISAPLEYRIAGWCKRALELAHSKNVRYTITKALSRHQGKTEIVFTWD